MRRALNLTSDPPMGCPVQQLPLFATGYFDSFARYACSWTDLAFAGFCRANGFGCGRVPNGKLKSSAA